MPSGVEQDSGLLARIIGGFVATVSGFFGLIMRGVNRRIDEIRQDVREHAERAQKELDTQRGHIARLFEKQEELRDDLHAAEMRSLTRHTELLQAIREQRK